MENSSADTSLVVNYLALRRLIGIFGIALPLAILTYAFALSNCGALESSISAYYHTEMRDIFVGILCAVGVFMIAYKGYDKDKIASRLAGICAIGVAMFPANDRALCGFPYEPNPTLGDLHIASATGLFATFAFMSIVLFTKSQNQARKTRQKKQRNIVYYACGVTIILCILLIAVYWLTKSTSLDHISPVFWLETISLLAFGISWLVKGETILKDKPATDISHMDESLVTASA